MTQARATTLGRALFAGTFVFLVLGTVGPLIVGRPPNADPPAFGALIVLALLAFSASGVLIVSRQPTNAIGWMFCAFGFVQSTAVAADGFAAGVLARSPHALVPRLADVWYSLVTGPGPVITFALVLLLFPTGRPLSRRWARAVQLTIITGATIVATTAVLPGPIPAPPVTSVNPLGIRALGGLIAAVQQPVYVALVLCIPLGAVSLILRFRRAGTIERQQIKWFASAGAFIAASFVAAPLYFWTSRSPGWLWFVVFGIDILLIPLACGIAILRYRLYDIDRFIGRTVSYALVSALLAGLFVSLVLAPSLVFGRGDRPSWVIALAVLVVAAVFRPVRRRIQDAVDRRFDRRRYDAARTIEAFTTKLREQYDMDALQRELRGVVGRTMQPAHMSLWLPKGES